MHLSMGSIEIFASSGIYNKILQNSVHLFNITVIYTS